jgi:hypothetical protein
VQALGRKTEKYLRAGVVTGGDSALTEYEVREIRRGIQATAGHERWVIDLKPSRAGGEPPAVERPGYFHVGIHQDERKLTVSLSGRGSFSFNKKRVIAALKKSPLVSEVSLLPPVDPEVWIFSIQMKTPFEVEVFELSAPARVILDVRAQKEKRSLPIKGEEDGVDHEG